MPFATINGIRVNYVIKGSGPHLLMFASGGFGSVIGNWTAQHGKGAWKEMDALETLSKYFTIIAYDRREAGFSGGRVEPLSFDLYVKEAKGLLDLAGAKEAYLLGGCMGASMVSAFAVRHPEVCKGLMFHWPVGGYGWMTKGRTFCNRHIEFVRTQGLAAVVARAPQKANFWMDPETGPWAAVLANDQEFAAQYVKHDVGQYISIVERTRDTIFCDTMPSGATGEELKNIRIPALIMSGRDEVHTVSASWVLHELLPSSERWDVLPPHQTGANTLEQILRYKAKMEAAA